MKSLAITLESRKGSDMFWGIKSKNKNEIYRDRIYIIKDILMKLLQYNELNLTNLISFSGLNMNKHKCIIERMEINGLISKIRIHHGKKIVSNYKITTTGLEFSRKILEPYEQYFPRSKQKIEIEN